MIYMSRHVDFVGVANGKQILVHSLAIPLASKSSYNSEAALKCDEIFH